MSKLASPLAVKAVHMHKFRECCNNDRQLKDEIKTAADLLGVPDEPSPKWQGTKYQYRDLYGQGVEKLSE